MIKNILNEHKNSSNVFINQDQVNYLHVVPRAVVQTTNSSNWIAPKNHESDHEQNKYNKQNI